MKTIELEEARRLVAEGGLLPDAERYELQQQRLRELVAYAREHSPYFAKLYAGVPEDFKLTDLPPTEKPTLLANYDDWVTDRRLHLQDVLDYVNRDPTKDQSRLLGDYTALRTSGSTGNPLPMVRDWWLSGCWLVPVLMLWTSPNIAAHRSFTFPTVLPATAPSCA